MFTNRLALIIGRLTSEHQSAFVRGRYILESVVTDHEVIHSVQSSGQKGLVLKIDDEKAYDKVNLDFLYEVLELRGFGARWIRWIKNVTKQGSIGVKINGEENDFFITSKGLRQGDPLSPLLFNLVVDVFTRMLVKGSQAGLIRGRCPNFCPGGVVCLQYEDDTLLFVDNDPRIAINLKWILTCFEMVSGMTINYHKSELVPINLDESESKIFLDIFECVQGAFPIKYLGIPLHYDKLRGEIDNL